MSQIIVCVGSGGVGKTTIASAVALMAAQEGKRTLVLTIDPSQRLKSLLGIGTSSEPTLIKEASIRGEMSAALIDAKKTFDSFIASAAASDSSVKKILNNKLYIQLSTTLSGSQEFTALESLYQYYRSGKYDLIVLDTPPAQHAIDFLRAPQKLNAIFNEGVTAWFRPMSNRGLARGLMQNLLQTGTKKVLEILESVTGSQFIHELNDFFVHIQDWEGKLEERTVEMHRMLVSSQTEFWLVSTLAEAKLREAEGFVREIRKGGYHLEKIILNRAVPAWLPSVDDSTLKAQPEDVRKYCSDLIHYYEQAAKLYGGFAKTFKNDIEVLRLSEYEKEPSQLSDLAQLAQQIGNQVAQKVK